jgi:hypothetical protein
MTRSQSSQNGKNRREISLFSGDNRGIAFTVDAILTALLLFSAVAYAAAQMPANPDQEVQDATAKSQLQQDVTDTLSVAHDRGDLNASTLYWDDDEANWQNVGGDSTYVQPPPGHPLEIPLNSFYTERGVGFNINVIYQRADGTSGTERMFYQGTPGPNAVVASQTVIIEDDDKLPDGTEVQNASSYFAPDALPTNDRYNVFRIQIVMWS